jgi:DNA mismatch repair protein MSH6
MQLIFELYEKDADIGHQEFDLKLTDRVNMRMVGVPESSFEYWAAKFIGKGYKVAKVDQMENAVGKAIRDRESNKKEEKIIRRELTSVLTRGTLVDGGLLTSDMNTYCMAIKEAQIDGDTNYGICFVDTSIAEFNFVTLENDNDQTKLETLLIQVNPKELILEKGCTSKRLLKIIRNVIGNIQLNYLTPETEFWDIEKTIHEVKRAEYFVKNSQDSADNPFLEKGDEFIPKFLQDIAQKNDLSMSAFGALLSYLRKLKLDKDLVSAQNFIPYDPIKNSSSLVLDGQTLINLEIFQNNYDGSDHGTLFKLLNHCSTPFGKRLFQKWTCHPLVSIPAINSRLDAVDDLNNLSGVFVGIQSKLKGLPDLERILARIHSNSCKIKDFVALLSGFEVIIGIYDDVAPFLEEFKSAELLRLFKIGISDSLRTQLEYFKNAFNHQEAVKNGFSMLI